MAVQTLSLTVLAQLFAGNLVKQTNRASVLLQLLPKVQGANSGKNIAFVPVDGTGVTAESYLEGADVVNFTSDAQATGILPWALYRKNFGITQLARDAAYNSSSPVGNVMLMKGELERAADALGSKMNQDLYIGDGTVNSFVGLDEAIGDAANTYAGIDRSVGGNAYFRPQVFNAAGPAVAISFEQIRSDLDAMFVAAGERPDIIIVHPNVYRDIAALFDEFKQFVVRTDVVRTSGGDIKLDGSRGALRFEEATVIEDKDCPTDRVYYLNSRYAKIHWMRRDPSGLDGINQTEIRVPGFEMPLYIDHLAKNGQADRFSLAAPSAQLVVDRPNSSGVRYNVA